MKAIRVFVDTGAWASIQIVDDAHHREAARTLRELLEHRAILITTNHVVGEAYTLLRVVRGYQAAAAFLRCIEATTRLERIFVPEEIEARAFALLAQFQDHDFSFVDATSFAVMRSRRIRYAFAFDSHFPTAGFPRLSLDMPVDNVR